MSRANRERPMPLSSRMGKVRVRSANGRASRVNDPEGTRRNIVEVATREFAQKGYGSARVDAIAAARAPASG